MLLQEYRPFNVDKQLVEASIKNNKSLVVTGVLQRAEAKNQNGRVYPRGILEREVKAYMEGPVKENRAMGELDHPESPVVALKNASHVVKELWWKGNDLMGRVELLNTPSGNIVKEILKGGHTIGISSRGTGSVQQTNEDTLQVMDDFELVCWDFVSNPSTHGAFMAPKALQEGAVRQKDKYGRINEIIREIICATTCECYLQFCKLVYIYIQNMPHRFGIYIFLIFLRLPINVRQTILTDG